MNGCIGRSRLEIQSLNRKLASYAQPAPGSYRRVKWRPSTTSIGANKQVQRIWRHSEYPLSCAWQEPVFRFCHILHVSKRKIMYVRNGCPLRDSWTKKSSLALPIPLPKWRSQTGQPPMHLVSLYVSNIHLKGFRYGGIPLHWFCSSRDVK